MEITDKVYLYGASGHAKVILDMLSDASVTVPCLIDDNPSVNELAGVPVVHSAEGLSPLIVSIGDCRIRRCIVEKVPDHQFVSVVVKDIPDKSLCYGNPARVIRKINQDADNKCIDPVTGEGKVILSIYAALNKNAA